mmetsp:Transcript_101279/g.325505  ORF Transcript_101279/g.325505 Transcript_101279/m.325505 type:complete len:406 (-) Transcript_101279:38-1255(-)
MKAGKCNQDFRLMGSDFQRRVVRHYALDERPPLEEAMWLITAPENFQVRTLKECSAMQLVAYILIAESKLYLQGPRPDAPPGNLIALAVQQAHAVPSEVYSSLVRAWPLEHAMQRFQDVAHRVQSRIAERSPPRHFGIQLVVCRCEEDLAWLATSSWPDEGASLLVYEACAGSDGSLALPVESKTLLGAAGLAVTSGLAPADAHTSDGDCGARIVLAHTADVVSAGDVAEDSAPNFVLFLPAQEPVESESRLLGFVAHSLRLRSLDVPFVSLGMRRSPPRISTACEREVWQAAFGEPSRPLGYLGARFLVGREALRGRSAAHYEQLLALLDHPPPACGDDHAGVASALSSSWHAAFGEPIRQPLRADDGRLPLFLRASDGFSGFAGTRLPQYSVILNSEAALSKV